MVSCTCVEQAAPRASSLRDDADCRRHATLRSPVFEGHFILPELAIPVGTWRFVRRNIRSDIVANRTAAASELLSRVPNRMVAARDRLLVVSNAWVTCFQLRPSMASAVKSSPPWRSEAGSTPTAASPPSFTPRQSPAGTTRHGAIRTIPWPRYGPACAAIAASTGPISPKPFGRRFSPSTRLTRTGPISFTPTTCASSAARRCSRQGAELRHSAPAHEGAGLVALPKPRDEERPAAHAARSVRAARESRLGDESRHALWHLYFNDGPLARAHP